jgi:DNA-binding CsgD family transcriptional regulator
MTGIDDSTIQRLIGQIYDAALDAEKWSTFLAAFADVCGGGAVMYVQDPTAAAGTRICYSAKLDRAGPEAYETCYSKIGPWLPDVARAPVGEVIPLSAWIDEAADRNCVVHKECFSRLDIHYQFSTVLHSDGKVHTAIVATRPFRAGDFTAVEFKLAQQLVPHLQRALQIQRRLVTGRLRHEALLRGLNGLGIGIILAAGDGHILFANEVAEAILRCGDGIGARRERLYAATPAATSELHRRVHGAACTGAKLGRHAGGVLSLPCRAGEMSLLICPFSIDVGIVIGPVVPTALIFLATPSDHPPTRQSDLKSVYDLTTAESKLVCALLAGSSVGAYAEVSGVSLATAKTHLQHVFRKTGQSRQSELLRHILSNPVLRLASKELPNEA